MKVEYRFTITIFGEHGFSARGIVIRHKAIFKTFEEAFDAATVYAREWKPVKMFIEVERHEVWTDDYINISCLGYMERTKWYDGKLYRYKDDGCAWRRV